MRGGWRGGRSLQSLEPAGGCDGDRRRRERSPQSCFPGSQLPQPGGRGGVAVTLETDTLPVCAHFRILYACVTSCFLLFTFFGASPVESRETLVPSSFGWVFIFLFCFVCSVSQEPAEACFWNPTSWVSPPNGGPRTAVRGSDLCAAPQGPFRPCQACYTISMLV